VDSIEHLARFHVAYADTAVRYDKPMAKQLAELSKLAPAPLCEYWSTHGWCSFLGGMFWMVNPIEYEQIKLAWPIGKDSPVIARTGFGDLLAIVENKLLILFVHTGRYILSPSSYDTFLGWSLAEPDDMQMFWMDLFEEGAAVLGRPGPGEIFSFEPALALGGEPTVQCLRRVTLGPALSILAQLHPELRRF
jgi:hypothetical protein